MFSRIRLIFSALALGFGAYVLYAAIIAPTFIVPRGGKRHINTPRASIDLSSEVERISRVNSELLAALFPDPNDWRRGNPLSAMPKDRSWLLLFPSDPKTENGGVTFESCTLVIPNTDTSLSEEERFRRGVVVETADRLEIRFKGQIDLQTLVVGFDPESLEGGRLYGKVTIWSNMDPDTRADDFRLVTRNLSFNHEQITTDSEVLIHYGNWQAEGVGLRASLDLPFKKKDSTEAEVESPSPLSEEFAQGNLAHGFSVRDVSLDKLNRFEFEIDDYLPTLPGANPWDGPAQTETSEVSDEPQTVKIDVRCRDKVYFAPNLPAEPSEWCARFAGEVEITAFHEEREQDSLRCDFLYFYLDDPILKEGWEKYGASYKGKRKPTGKLFRLTPYRIRAIGTPERKSELQVGGGFFHAEGGEILCEIEKQRISLQPLSDLFVPEETTVANREEQVSLRYGGTNVVSDRIEFVYDPKTYGVLRASQKGRLETDLPGDEPEHLTVRWNEQVKIAPIPDEPEHYSASFRGGVSAESGRYGTLSAGEADFWFQLRHDEAADGEPSFVPLSAQLRQNVEMNTARGDCRIRDVLEILFDRQSDSSAPNLAGENPSAAPLTTKEKNPFLPGGSMMGEGEDAVYTMSAGRLKLWVLLRQDGKVDVSHIVMQDHLLFVETDPVEKKEILHIDGNDVRIENPGSDRVSVILRGHPANFTGSGLNLSGYDIRVNRPENMFSVIGSGRLRFTPRSGKVPSEKISPTVSEEPVEVWWPNGMAFDGKSLVFQGDFPPSGRRSGSKPKENGLVNVRQGRSLELKALLITLTLKRPIQIFDFDMEEESDDVHQIELDQTICQGTPSVPVTVSWFGTVPNRDTAGQTNPLRGRGTGEATYLTLNAESGDFTASGPGWLRGVIETPKSTSSGRPAEGERAEKQGLETELLPASKPWSHFHLVFQENLNGNIRNQNAKTSGGVRFVLGTSEESDIDLNVNEHDTFPPDAFFLTCNELGVAGVVSPNDESRSLELTAFGDTRFDYQAFVGRGEILKYDHRKRSVMMQGSGVAPASLSRQERPGAPVNTQTFNSASFNLETKKIDLNLSGTRFSAGN